MELTLTVVAGADCSHHRPYFIKLLTCTNRKKLPLLYAVHVYICVNVKECVLKCLHQREMLISGEIKCIPFSTVILLKISKVYRLLALQ